jgi:hypothetical protein
MLGAVQICGSVLAEFSQKWPKKGQILKCFVFCIFPIWNIKKSRIFTYFGTGMVSKFSNILIKWNQRCYFYKGAAFVGLSG